MKERVFRYRKVEREIVSARPKARVLDVGCGVGENLVRLARYGAQPLGIDPALERLRSARAVAPVASAWGEQLPWRDASFDLVYLSHILHHARSVAATLGECHRVLRPGGVLFGIETVDDSPLMRLARRIQPRWEGDDVLNRFRFGDLIETVRRTGFEVEAGKTFNWMYFAWELLPLRYPVFEWVTPIGVVIESALAPLLDRFGGHCWFVAHKPGPPIFPARGAGRGPGPPGADPS